MLPVAQARARILATLAPPAADTVPLDRAFGRFLAAPVLAAVDLPTFDNSAVDGYAVQAADVRPASDRSPVVLRRLGRVSAGTQFAGTLTPGTCVRLFTGSPLPAGADAVVMQEDVRPAPAEGEAASPGVAVHRSVAPGENVRRRGQDVRAGTPIVEAGARIDAATLSLLAATGCASVRSAPAPRVTLLATGDELVPPGSALAPGQIYESNTLGLAALVTAVGGVPHRAPPVRDDLEATQTALRRAFAETDLVVTCGGVSVGEEDHVKSAFAALGGQLELWRVAMKPGKPFAFGRWQGRWLFGLPGNPVSSFVTFLLLVRPALLRLQGARDLDLPTAPGVLGEAVANPGDRTHYLRVRLDPEGVVRPTGLQASHALRSLAGANALLELPPGSAWPESHPVRVLRFA